MEEFIKLWAAADLYVQKPGIVLCLERDKVDNKLVETPFWEMWGFDSESDYQEDEADGVFGFGFDNMEYRLVELRDTMEFYAWCYNSHGSTNVFSCPKDTFLAEIEKISEEIKNAPREKKHDAYGACMSRLETQCKKSGKANWG